MALQQSLIGYLIGNGRQCGERTAAHRSPCGRKRREYAPGSVGRATGVAPDRRLRRNLPVAPSMIGGWPGGRRAVANRPALGGGNESRSRPWGSCYSALMKAAVHTRYGPPEVVQISEVKKPTAEDNGLLIKVHATTVNRTDCGFWSGKPFFSRFFTGLVGPKGDGHEARVLREESRRSAVTSRPSRSATECSDSSDSAARSVLMLNT